MESYGGIWLHVVYSSTHTQCSTLHALKIQFPLVSTYRGGIPRILQRMYICRRVITFLLNFSRYKFRLARHLLLESACEYEEA